MAFAGPGPPSEGDGLDSVYAKEDVLDYFRCPGAGGGRDAAVLVGRSQYDSDRNRELVDGLP